MKDELQYSTMQKEYFGITKKLIRKYGEAKCMRHLIALAKEKNNYTDGERHVFLQMGGCYIRCLSGTNSEYYSSAGNDNIKVLHCFIETKELFDFLKSTEIKELQLANKFIKKYGNFYMGPGVCFDGSGKESMETKVAYTLKMAIHHKKLSEGSILIDSSFILDEQFSSFMTLQDSKIEMGTTHYNFKDINCLSEINKEKESNQKLFLNLCLYADAFENCILEGTPEEIKKFKNFYKTEKSNIIKIKTHESLFDTNSKTPHLRRGHFKKLKSDFYKNKKGQIIFIKSTMINAKAITVKEKIK